MIAYKIQLWYVSMQSETKFSPRQIQSETKFRDKIQEFFFLSQKICEKKFSESVLD